MSLADRHWKAVRKKGSGAKRGYPVATVAFYGPNSNLATKVAVGIVLGPDREASELRRWYSTTVDVRRDQNIASEILDFLKSHGVKEVALMESVFGCPHEEGVDYPEGEWCPHCPYWKNRDRYTHKILQ